jgi:hypothetical protein
MVNFIIKVIAGEHQCLSSYENDLILALFACIMI